MELILIACCKEKSFGGTPDYSSPVIKELLSPSTFTRLLSIRKALSQIKNISPGVDLGAKLTQDRILYRPAYLRYAGRVYERSQFKYLYPAAKNLKVLIISALYGVVDANDPIRLYEAVMDETLPNHSRLSTWWKQQELGKIVEEIILALHPHRVHDLLSMVYHSALTPWPPVRLDAAGIQYVPYDYPGQGTGSLWHRGDDLKRLLMANK